MAFYLLWNLHFFLTQTADNSDVLSTFILDSNFNCIKAALSSPSTQHYFNGSVIIMMVIRDSCFCLPLFQGANRDVNTLLTYEICISADCHGESGTKGLAVVLGRLSTLWHFLLDSVASA